MQWPICAESVQEQSRRFGRSTTSTIMAVQSGTSSANGLAQCTGCVQAQRSLANEIHRVEDAHSAGIAEDGKTAHP